ncbi:MAG: asparagine synthase (glutamine-hydrolyzing) [Bacteroidetes bacterium 4572_112]|nr:MAG: asparagine synthase (glutamine-hydrolyzing) [Bacteroidetes bacterium 4572_112]
MCGIAGIINFNKQKYSDNLIWEITNTMIHRGPDGGGIHIDEGIGFGHRRLSILDLSEAGKQPFVQNDLTITFNGEIYNFQEIKDNIGSFNYKSETDTEVILNAYRKQGISCINDFNGMFSFALFDKSRQKVFLVRDRMGIKPMYYSQVGDEIVFGSEVKALLASNKIKANYSNSAISNYLSFRYPVGTQSFYENIFQLEPAHYLEIDLKTKKIDKVKYWDVPINANKEDKGEDYYIDELRQILSDSVKYRMIADVDFGAYLSGGLDSSIVVSLMSKMHSRSIKTFTIGFEEKDYNEFEYSKMVADMYDTQHNTMLLDPSKYFETSDMLIGYKDAPLSVPNEPALYLMSKALKEHFTVVLSGEGADELFGGYGRIFRSPYDFERYNGITAQGIDSTVSQQFLNSYKDKYGAHSKDITDHFLKLYKYMSLDDKKMFMSKEFIKSTNNDKPLYDYFAKHFKQSSSLSLSEQYMWVFEKIHIQGLLNRLDMTTMAASVEGRVPFVDHKLIEFAFNVPLKYKLKWRSESHKLFSSHLMSDKISEAYDTPKYLLKKAYEKDLPSEVVWRRKMGFPVPLHKWFGESFNEYAKEVLLDNQARRRNIFNSVELEHMLSDKDNFKQHSFGLKVWMLVNLELWMNKYFN